MPFKPLAPFMLFMPFIPFMAGAVEADVAVAELKGAAEVVMLGPNGAALACKAEWMD